jgi:hypothetical protein
MSSTEAVKTATDLADIQFTIYIQTMAFTRLALRAVRPSLARGRFLSTTPRRFAGPGNAKEHETAEDHRKIQLERPLNPNVTGKYSTIGNKMPSVGAYEPPPELLTSVDPGFTTSDSSPEAGKDAEMGVGEMEGAEFKIEPLRRTGEDANTKRARLLCL